MSSVQSQVGSPDPAKPGGQLENYKRAQQQFRDEVRACEPHLFARARSLTHHEADAADLVQRTLEKGFRFLHTFESGTNLRCWLMRILFNLFLDDCRRAAREPRLEPLDDAKSSLPACVPPEETVAAWESMSIEQVHAAVEGLSSVSREIYHLRVVEKLTYEQIAIRLKIPLGTVATRLARVRAKLQRLLAGDRAPSASEEEEAP